VAAKAVADIALQTGMRWLGDGFTLSAQADVRKVEWRCAPQVFNLTVFVSLLLCAGSALLWARRDTRIFAIEYGTTTRYSFISSEDGVLFVGRMVGKGFNCGWRVRSMPTNVFGEPADTPAPPGHEFADRVKPGSDEPVVLWNSLAWSSHYYTIHGMNLSTFAWLCLILPAMWSMIRLKAWIGAHRARGILCAQCGYDLRATPDRCPECGTVPEGKTKNPESRLNHYQPP
jgi:hypothetical protein